MFNWLRRLFRSDSEPVRDDGIVLDFQTMTTSSSRTHITPPIARVSVSKISAPTLKTEKEWEAEGRRVDHTSFYPIYRSVNGQLLYSMDMTLPLLLLATAAMQDYSPAATPEPVTTISGSDGVQQDTCSPSISDEDTRRDSSPQPTPSLGGDVDSSHSSHDSGSCDSGSSSGGSCD